MSQPESQPSTPESRLAQEDQAALPRLRPTEEIDPDFGEAWARLSRRQAPFPKLPYLLVVIVGLMLPGSPFIWAGQLVLGLVAMTIWALALPELVPWLAQVLGPFKSLSAEAHAQNTLHVAFALLSLFLATRFFFEQAQDS